jgi:acetylornithine deacetylase/succinyl-diaminopimelate desuccinylase-like protein
MESVINFIARNQDRYLAELAQFLAIPSISALPEHTGDVRRCAEWAAATLARAGLRNVRLIESKGNPLVYADWLNAPGAPTLLYYGHYDVQPVDPVELWTSPPFEATIRDGKIYARGASDDKGQVFMHVMAIEAHLATRGVLPVNIKIILEGEEEVGLSHFETFVRTHGELLAADAVIISDGAMFDDGVPAICYGLRGLVYLQIDIRGTASDLHSGSFGGTVANPALVLAQVLSKLKDGAGRIAIRGFYDGVRPLGDAERTAFARLPFDESKYRAGLGAPALSGEAGYSTLERLWARPTLDVNGLHAGFTGHGAKTVIPATAMAKVSMRIVPDQDPDTISELFEAFVRDVTPATVDISVTRLSGGKPWTTSVDNPFVRAASRALEKAFGTGPVFIREGGSNPIVRTFDEVLGVPIALFDLGSPDDRPHAPDEKLNVASLQLGAIAAAHLYEEVGQFAGNQQQERRTV